MYDFLTDQNAKDGKVNACYPAAGISVQRVDSSIRNWDVASVKCLVWTCMSGFTFIEVQSFNKCFFLR